MRDHEADRVRALKMGRSFSWLSAAYGHVICTNQQLDLHVEYFKCVERGVLYRLSTGALNSS
jgi:hypothetical protein